MRDASYVMSGLCPHDRAEFEGVHGRIPPAVVAARMAGHIGPHAYLARVRETPVAVFGAAPLEGTTVSAWMLGTPGKWRAVPAITRFVDGPLRRQLVRDGYRWAEARSINGYDRVHRWLEYLGGGPIVELPGYGINGEDYTLFRAKLDI